jgi:hypothetical protein
MIHCSSLVDLVENPQKQKTETGGGSAFRFGVSLWNTIHY